MAVGLCRTEGPTLNSIQIPGVTIRSLKTIPTDGGSVRHALKRSDPEFRGFGEVYFSSIGRYRVRGWSRHQKMTLNLVVVTGAIRFVLVDDRMEIASGPSTEEVTLSAVSSYSLLTVPPGIWMAFEGIGSEQNTLANIADIEHDPDEIERAPLDKFNVEWHQK